MEYERCGVAARRSSAFQLHPSHGIPYGNSAKFARLPGTDRPCPAPTPVDPFSPTHHSLRSSTLHLTPTSNCTYSIIRRPLPGPPSPLISIPSDPTHGDTYYRDTWACVRTHTAHRLPPTQSDCPPPTPDHPDYHGRRIATPPAVRPSCPACSLASRVVRRNHGRRAGD